MEIFGLCLVIGLFVSWILPWVNFGRVSRISKELEQLKAELWNLQHQQHEVAGTGAATEQTTETSATIPDQAKEMPLPGEAHAEIRDPGAGVISSREMGRASACLVSEAVGGEAHAEIRDTGEGAISSQDWFSKLAVWVGGVALLMAGFYMVKYSIESGWLNPLVRLWLTVGFGALLCAAGFVIGIRSVMLGNKRIGQALSGAGVACLYFAAYAAVHLYGFVTSGEGFVAMLIVTFLAVVMSLKNGAPIAMLGLVGGFFTPWLMRSDTGDTVQLFVYLFLLFCGAQLLCVLRGWWALLLGSLVGAYVWSILVILGSLGGFYDSVAGTLIFVMGVCCVNAVWAFFIQRDALCSTARNLLSAIRVLTWGGGLLQGLILVLIGGFAEVDMMLFSVLSVGALMLAVLREGEFIWAAYMALVAVGVATLANVDTALWSWLIVPCALFCLFCLMGHWRGLRAGRALVWRRLSVASALLAVPLLYLNREYISDVEAVLHSWHWLCLAAVFAGMLALAGEHLYRRQAGAQVVGEYSAFALFLLSFGLWVYVANDYLAHAVAGLVIVAALYWKWRQFGRFALVVAVLGVAWSMLMLLHAGGVCAYFFGEEFYYAPEPDGLAMWAWILGLIAAGTAFGCFARVWAVIFSCVMAWGLGLVGFFGLVACYQWLDVYYMPDAWSNASVEGGLTALLAVLAVVLVYCARKWSACGWASCIVAGLVGLRVVMLHLGDSGAQGDRFFWNARLLQFGVPFVVACVLAWERGVRDNDRARRIYQVAAMLLGFIWTTFLVQNYFGASQLLAPSKSSTEIYTYSAVWLSLAVAYQAIGLWRQQAAIHVGSLVLLLVTIAKVFLVDASELEGLYRVLSFLGLGLVLIGIGFFYNHVVFAREVTKSISTEAS